MEENENTQELAICPHVKVRFTTWTSKTRILGYELFAVKNGGNCAMADGDFKKLAEFLMQPSKIVRLDKWINSSIEERNTLIQQGYRLDDAASQVYTWIELFNNAGVHVQPTDDQMLKLWHIVRGDDTDGS